MDHGEDARAEELHNLRLALATFALQLDAFEMRTSRVLLGAGTKSGKSAIPTLWPIRLQASEGRNDWASIKSPGSKSGT